jgi:DNA transposition AAA+ family ATPase
VTTTSQRLEQSSTEAVTAESILPFIELDQYLDLVAMCDFVREYRYMGLLRGPAGAGKTISAKRYRNEQPLMTANGQSPVLYFQLARGEENHKAFYRRVIEAITGVPYQKRLSAADMISEAKRLLRRYGYDLIIADEIGNMNNDGIEGARTLHDEVGIPIIFIGMDDGFKDRMEAELPQFYSRIAEVLEFGLLSYEMLKDDVLPQVSPASHLTFSPEQADADEIAGELFTGAGGNSERGARFRDVQVLLVRCHHILAEKLKLREQLIAENPGKRAPRMPVFNAEIVREAVKKSKQRGKQRRPKAEGKSNSPSLVRED